MEDEKTAEVEESARKRAIERIVEMLVDAIPLASIR